MNNKSNKTAFYGTILGLALILSYIEFLIPFNFGIPGIKLGLCNIIAVSILYKKGFKQSFLINCARIILSSILFGNIFGAVYSLCGGILSTVIMALLKKTDKFSVLGVSVAGAVMNNLGQTLAATVVLSTYRVLGYLPILAISGILTGALIGLAVTLIIKKLPKSFKV